MKILIYNDWKTLMGGTERYIHNLLPFLTRHHEVHFVAAEDILPINNLSDYQRRLTFWKKNKILIQYLKVEIEKFQPDVIHINNVYYYFHSVFIAIGFRNVPIALTLHDTQYLHLQNDNICRYLLKKIKISILNRVVQSYFAPSQKIFQMANNQFFKDVHYLPHFIDVKKWPCQNQDHNNKLNLLYVGNIDRKKGVFFILDVIIQMLKNKFDVSMTFIGKGKDEQALANEIKGKKLVNKIKILGHQNDSSIQHFFSNHFALVLPSLYMESFGLVGLEAQASGIPVIVSDIGSVSEWAIEKETAILAHSNDINDWCNKIEQLWMNKQLYNHIRFNAIKLVNSDFQPQIHYENLIDRYNKLM